jgi:hypothetical protein
MRRKLINYRGAALADISFLSFCRVTSIGCDVKGKRRFAIGALIVIVVDDPS